MMDFSRLTGFNDQTNLAALGFFHQGMVHTANGKQCTHGHPIRTQRAVAQNHQTVAIGNGLACFGVDSLQRLFQACFTGVGRVGNVDGSRAPTSMIHGRDGSQFLVG